MNFIKRIFLKYRETKILEDLERKFSLIINKEQNLLYLNKNINKQKEKHNMMEYKNSQFECQNSEEIIANSIRAMKQFLVKRVDAVKASPIPAAPELAKETAKAAAPAITYWQETAYQKGYLKALEDLQQFIHTVGM